MIALNLLAACSLDAAFGDPRWIPHPVRGMGFLIQKFEQAAAHRCRRPPAQYIAGIVLALGLPIFCYTTAQGIIDLANQLHPFIGEGVWIVLGYTTLAARDLWNHAMHVYWALESNMLPEARCAVSKIVGRETANLSESNIIRATIETVAENTSDGVIAPLLYLALGGPPLALAYKAVNTLDSMIGHRSERYCYLGWASARLDDMLNWIPARITALMFVLTAGIFMKQGRRTWRIMLRDGRKHDSPNSGWPEAAMAGALQVQLGGMNVYQNVCVNHPRLGDAGQPLKPMHIYHAVQLMGLSSILVVCGLVGILW